MSSRPSTAAPILAVLAIVLVTLASYVGGYLLLGEKQDVLADFEVLVDPEVSSIAELESLAPGFRLRVFPYRWEAALFQPLASLESWLQGFPVHSIETNVVGR